MNYKLLYENIIRINHGILCNFSYINLKYSNYSLNFVDFLYQNGYILNYLLKYPYIILFLKFKKSRCILNKLDIDSNLLLWRWYRYKRLVSKKTLFLRRYKTSEMKTIIFHTTKGFLFFENVLLNKLGGHYICQIKI